jgi:hypothetical protein
VLIGTDLLAWAKALCLDGELATAEPQRIRYTLLHTAGVLVRSARRATLRLAAGWPLGRPAARRVHPTTRMGPNARLSTPTPRHTIRDHDAQGI